MPTLHTEVIVSCLDGKCLGEKGQRKQKYLWERRRMVMCVREMAQWMVPVRAVPTVRCSATVKIVYKSERVGENSGREGRKRYAKAANQRWAL